MEFENCQWIVFFVQELFVSVENLLVNAPMCRQSCSKTNNKIKNEQKSTSWCKFEQCECISNVAKHFCCQLHLEIRLLQQ